MDGWKEKSGDENGKQTSVVELTLYVQYQFLRGRPKKVLSNRKVSCLTMKKS